jgi:DNA-binding NarL/FixJ family response regulator
LSIEEVAVQLRVKISTLRTHLSNALAKTGTTRVGDLLRLVGLIPKDVEAQLAYDADWQNFHGGRRLAYRNYGNSTL